MAEQNKDNLIYYKNREQVLTYFKWTSIAFWTISILIDIAYYLLHYFTQTEKKKFELSNSHLMLAAMNFLVPNFMKVLEAWANGAIQSLFGILKI